MAESPAGLDRPRGVEADGVGLPWPALLAGWAAVALVVAGVALAVAGGAPEPPPAGLPDAGPATGWALPVLRLAEQKRLGNLKEELIPQLGETIATMAKRFELPPGIEKQLVPAGK